MSNPPRDASSLARQSGRRLLVGLSASLLHADPERAIFGGRSLAYVERSMPEYVGALGALVVVVPPPARGDGSFSERALEYAHALDGLVVTGGVDMAPESYGQTALRPEWSGDRERDDYELALVAAFHSQKKPIFGICRGHQVLNVAFGGTLLQDVPTLVGTEVRHRDAERYHSNEHPVEVVAGSWLARTLGRDGRVVVNSVHHQAVDRLAEGFVVEAIAPDGVVEAIALEGTHWVKGVQWHPEFVGEPGPARDDALALLASFEQAARARARHERDPVAG